MNIGEYCPEHYFWWVESSGLYPILRGHRGLVAW